MEAANVLAKALKKRKTPLALYPVPRGGVPACYALGACLTELGIRWTIVSSPQAATHIVDDLVDSGGTSAYYQSINPAAQFVSLFVKNTKGGNAIWLKQPHLCGLKAANEWLIFPWEDHDEEVGIEDNVTRLLQYIGEDPERGGLIETPKRVAKAWDFWTSGYDKKPEDILKVFEDGAENYDELVIVKDIPFYTHCEHHMAPFFGTASIGYIPSGKIVGLSKLSRLLEMFARRLQVQERLTNQVADAIEEHLKPLGVGVLIEARHLCMESRGICQQGHMTRTCAVRGVLRTQEASRAEFLSLTK